MEPDDGVILGMGAYLGELLVRRGSGHWEYDQENGAAVVAMPNVLVAYPHSKIAKRIEHGPEHDIHAFFTYSLTRQTPPDSQLRSW